MIEGGGGGFAAIDFNPRLYGCIALATGAGAAIPAVWCRWMLERSSEARPARPGVYYRWEEAEVRNLLLRLRSGRLRDALAVIRPRRPLARAYLRWSDPLPALVMLARMVKSRLEDRRSAKAERRAEISASRRGGAAPEHGGERHEQQRRGIDGVGHLHDIVRERPEERNAGARRQVPHQVRGDAEGQSQRDLALLVPLQIGGDREQGRDQVRCCAYRGAATLR